MRRVPGKLSILALAFACLVGYAQTRPAGRPSRLMANEVSNLGLRQWRVAATLHAVGRLTLMESVAAPTPDDGWAIGVSASPGGRRGSSLIEHWAGRKWRSTTVPAKLLDAFDARTLGDNVIGASSVRNVWAFNQMTSAWLHWTGRAWVEGKLAAPSGSRIVINSVLALNHQKAWAVGLLLNDKDNVVPYAARYNGHRWEMTPIPGKLALPVAAASAVSPTDIWAVLGRAGSLTDPAAPSGGALANWNGRRWALVRLPAALGRHGDAASVMAISDRNIWVGGGVANAKEGLSEAAAHWDGTNWQVSKFPVIASPRLYVLSQIIRSGRSGLTALATCATCVKIGNWSRLWRLSGGRWEGPVRPRLTSRSSALTDLASAGDTNSEWATGFTPVGSSYNGIIAVYGPLPH